MIEELRLVEGQESIVSPSSVDKAIQTDEPKRDNTYLIVGDAGTVRRGQWQRYIPYCLTLGVASALLFTLLSKVPVAARSRLPVYKEDGNYRGVHRILSLGMPSSSITEHEEQQHTQDARMHPPAGEKDASPSSLVPPISPLRPEEKRLLYDQWGLPMLDQFERTLHPSVKQGKDEIAAFLATRDESKASPPEASQGELTIVARALSGGASDSLVGMTLILRNVRPLHWMERSGPLSRVVRINKLLGTGFSAIVVEIEDMDNHEVFAMRIRRQRADTARWFDNDDSFIAEIQREFILEEEATRQLCGVIPASKVALKKGIAVPLYNADIAGVPDAQRFGDYFIFGHVQLMERLGVAVMDLFLDAEDVVKKSREYIGRRLIQIVLKIQQAGASHNDLKWDNVLLRADGTFLVGDLASVLPFGSPYRELTFFTPQYREPQLGLAEKAAYESGFNIPQASSDLWSLGIMLYELFTNETYPYGEMEAEDIGKHERMLAKWLIQNNTRSASLTPDLKAAEVPPVWMRLIQRLLEPNKRYRITGWGILEEFPELVHNPK
ncbi:hypothetical protein, conserved [Eimeria praecox]|uniref:non-specific serine/threonine protein kinase n=1 Tax=Eimeria praecox TaxID=51316 RepID=U6G4V7_9EIME|nr:hypothetical protein, conserved [Eimeria praecox]